MIPALMNKKKAVTAILGGLHGERDEIVGDADDASLAIAKDVLRALDSKSAPALKDALKAFFLAMEAEEPEEEA